MRPCNFTVQRSCHACMVAGTTPLTNWKCAGCRWPKNSPAESSCVLELKREAQGGELSIKASPSSPHTLDSWVTKHQCIRSQLSFASFCSPSHQC